MGDGLNSSGEWLEIPFQTHFKGFKRIVKHRAIYLGRAADRRFRQFGSQSLRNGDSGDRPADRNPGPDGPPAVGDSLARRFPHGDGRDQDRGRPAGRRSPFATVWGPKCPKYDSGDRPATAVPPAGQAPIAICDSLGSKVSETVILGTGPPTAGYPGWVS